MKEEDDVDDEEDDDLTRQMLSNQFGRIHIIYIYIMYMHRDLLIPPSSVTPACLVVCRVPPCDSWVRFPDLRISYPACMRISIASYR